MCINSNVLQVLAFYLPQYHEIPENNEWWGEGFTEWTNVKKATPLYRGHLQPRVPYNNEYYDLSNPDVMLKQMDMARQYGVDGFCFYHYWFRGKKLLERPLERLLNEKRELLPYCFCWANEPWTRTWDGMKGAEYILMSQDYGEEVDWIEHWDYLNLFFKQDAYIKVNGKPVIVIYNPNDIKNIKEMFECWHWRAKQNGYEGIYILNISRFGANQEKKFIGDGIIDFEPFATLTRLGKEREYLKVAHKGNRVDNYGQTYHTFDYATVCEKMTRRYTLSNDKHFLGFFAGWDNTPRKGIDTKIIFDNNTPSNFEKYFDIQYQRSLELKNRFIFINAWNEWGEGTFLEPDEKYKFQYLEAIHRVRKRYQ